MKVCLVTARMNTSTQGAGLETCSAVFATCFRARCVTDREQGAQVSPE